MKKILSILIALFLLALASGCSDSDSNDKNNTPKAQNSSSSAASVSPTTKSSNTIVDTPKEKPSNTLEYKNSQLGFSLTFPASWKDKYKVVEKDGGINIFFVPTTKNPNDEGGLFFSILPKGDSLDEDHFDTVGDKRYFQSKGVTYVIGGPTDVGFDPNNPEYNLYKQMKSNIPEILDTLKNTN